MNSTRKPLRGAFGRATLGAALALGVAAGALCSAPAFAAKPAAPKIEYSPGFVKVAAELDKSLKGARENPAVQTASRAAETATDPAAKAAAAAQVDAALGGARAKLDAARAAATTPGDKFTFGNMLFTYAGLIADVSMQREGVVTMLDSGATPEQALPQVNGLAGITSYQLRDYAGAARYLQAAKDRSWNHPQLDALLYDSYEKSGNAPAALAAAQKEISAAKAAGRTPSEVSLRTSLVAVYKAKQLAEASQYAADLVRYYPTPESWNLATVVVRELASLPPEENIDLMRLMSRTGAMRDSRDYLEYIQNATGRVGVRYPGEVVSVAQQGINAGKIQRADVADALTTAQSMIAQDRASLDKQRNDAKAPSASAATVLGSADAFLSYSQPAVAEELYKLAMNKPGVDKNRVLTRLGIAQADEGKFAEAKANFDQVEGTRKPVAQLWSSFVAQKAGGATQAAGASQ